MMVESLRLQCSIEENSSLLESIKANLDSLNEVLTKLQNDIGEDDEKIFSNHRR